MVDFPNVPIAPGVPPLPRSPLAIIAAISLLAGDAEIFFPNNGVPQWGIFLNGSPVILADNVVTMDFKQDYTISNYPIEGGGFETYDKVQLPFEARLAFSTGGSVTDRQQFLSSIEQIIGNTEVYDVYTPERYYQNVNLKHYDYNREARNVGLLTVDIWVQQINQNAEQLFQNVQAPNSASPVSNGNVAPTTPTAAQATAVSGMIK